MKKRVKLFLEKKNTNKNSLNFPKVNELYGKKMNMKKKDNHILKNKVWLQINLIVA